MNEIDIYPDFVNAIFRSVDCNTADVVNCSDYYPYGMLMPNRNGSVSVYRYGFQGQEMDDEVSGKGNSYTAEFWQYDSRLGRRWNIDPVVKPHESPYAAFANNPIWFIDPSGADSSLYDKSNGGFIEKGVTPKDDKTAIWLVDMKGKDYDPNDPWATAVPLTYTVGKGQDCKCVKGSKLKDNHPLKNKGWKVGGQVYVEDLIDVGAKFDEIMKEAVPNFESYGVWNSGLARDIWFYYQVGTDEKYDLKSWDENDGTDSFGAAVIGEWSFDNGILTRMDDWGNISYGVLGRAVGYHLNVLVEEADDAQKRDTNTSDDSRDVQMIKYGFNKRFWRYKK